MAQRFGRKRKKKLLERIVALEAMAFGPYGPAPDHLMSIDKWPITSKITRINDEPDRQYDVEVEVDVVAYTSKIMDQIHEMHSLGRPVRLDGRALRSSRITIPRQDMRSFQDPTVTISFRQVQVKSR